MVSDHLEAMGIQRWVQRPANRGADPGSDPDEQAGPGNLPEQLQVAGGDAWQTLQQRVASCELCSLSKTRTNTVFGAGSEKASWMFVGEAPGAEEDRQGMPFVGRAGKLLTAIIEALGMTRDEVYIANVLKCRPPGNRDPMGEEVRHCQSYLRDQLAHVQPDIIIALGAFAARALLRTEEPISRLRGQVYRYGESEIPLIATYHPAYLLRSPLEKRKVWDDLKLALRQLGTD